MNKVLSLMALVFFYSELFADTYHAEVTAITDGDTIVVLRANSQKVRIRLAGIDCPETNQPWGSRAKRAASDYMERKHVAIEEVGQDRYERTIGRVFVDGVNINRALVGDGHCWAYTRYAKDKVLSDLQDQAMKRQSGLWELIEPVPPWEWRRKR